VVVTILSGQSVICSVVKSHFSIGTARLAPQQRYHLKRAVSCSRKALKEFKSKIFKKALGYMTRNLITYNSNISTTQVLRTKRKYTATHTVYHLSLCSVNLFTLSDPVQLTNRKTTLHALMHKVNHCKKT